MAAVRTYPSDIKDEEWAFVASYLCLMREDAPQREYALRDLFNALRYLAHTGCPWRWRYLPPDLPPWATVYQQWARWRDARVFERAERVAASLVGPRGHPHGQCARRTHLTEHA